MLLLAVAAVQVNQVDQAAVRAATAAAAVRAHQDKEIMAVLLHHQAMAAAVVRGLSVEMEQVAAAEMEAREAHPLFQGRPLPMRAAAVVALLAELVVQVDRELEVMEHLINQRAARVQLIQVPVVVVVDITLEALALGQVVTAAPA